MARKSMQEKQITIYLPTKQDVERWQSLSDASGNTLSRWIFYKVEEALEEDRPTTPKTRTIQLIHESPIAVAAAMMAMEQSKTDNLDEINRLRRENSELRREVDQMKKLNSRFQLQNFLENETLLDKIKPLEEKIKAVLKNGGTWSSKKIVREFASENPRLLNRVLQNLVDEGLIEELESGFRWKN